MDYCISTTTTGALIEIGSLPVTDDNGNSYYATTSCPGVVETYQNIVDNPSQDMFNGILLLIIMLSFVTWYWLSRLRLK